MIIKDVVSDYYRIPLPVPLSDATHGLMEDFELITVKVTTDNGHEGVGYTYTPGTGGTAIYSAIKDVLGPLVVGLDSRRIEAVWNKMWWGIHYAGRSGISSFAISAIDIALWDLKARSVNEPLWRLLGGCNPEVDVYKGGIDLDFTLDQLCDQINDVIEEGHHATKIKAGRKRLSEDIERIKTVREMLGPDRRLMVDANMKWSVDEAIRAARALVQYDLYWLEEPTIPEDVAGMAQIFQEGGIPIAAGENLHSLCEFNQLIGSRAALFPEIDIANVGGVSTWLKIAHIAEANNLNVTSHGVHDLSVHLLAAVPNASYLEIHGFGLERFTEEALEIKNGVALAPDRPGHGVNFMWDKLNEHRES